jgi:hypothetical protein
MIHPKQVFFFVTALLLQGALQAQPLTSNVRLAKRVAAPASDTIYHQAGQLLVWDNFKGTPQAMGRVAALTSSGFGFDAGMAYSRNKGTINISVYAFFNKSKSWVKPDKKSAYILAHEQLHFDVSCIGMLLFIQKLRTTSFTVQNYSAELNRLYNEAYRQMYDMQDVYDKETDNGIKRSQQQEWSQRIKTQLALLQSTIK